MNRILIGCGIAAIVVVGVLGSLAAIALIRAQESETAARSAAREAVLAFVTTWNEDELIKRADDEWKTKEYREKLDKLFTFYRRLGTFKSLGEANGKVEARYFAGEKDNGIVSNYSFPATFSAGTATIDIRSHKEPSGWKIIGINIRSEAFVR